LRDARRGVELIAWQLASTLETEIVACTASPPASRDFRYSDQSRESAHSATSNIAEGFGRYYPKGFIRFLRIAAGSLHETKNHLHKALDRRFITPANHERLTRLCIRAIKANNRLIGYLLHAQAPEPFANTGESDTRSASIEPG